MVVWPAGGGINARRQNQGKPVFYPCLPSSITIKHYHQALRFSNTNP